MDYNWCVETSIMKEKTQLLPLHMHAYVDKVIELPCIVQN